MRLLAVLTVLLVLPFVMAGYGEGQYGVGEYGIGTALWNDPVPESGPTGGNGRRSVGVSVINPVEQVPPILEQPVLIEQGGHSGLLLEIEQELDAMRAEGFSTKRFDEALEEAGDDRLRALLAEIQEQHSSALKAKMLIASLDEKLLQGKDSITGNVVYGVEQEYPVTQNLVVHASSAINAGEYITAAALATEGQRSYEIERRTDLSSLAAGNWGSIIILVLLLVAVAAAARNMFATGHAEQPMLARDIATIIAASVIFLAAVLSSLTFVWADAILNDVHQELSMLSETAAIKIQGEYNYIEATTEDLEAIASMLDAERAKRDPAYLQSYLEMTGPLMRSIGEISDGAVGVFLYLRPEEFGSVPYLWYNLENGTFMWTDDDEINDTGYLMTAAYSDNPDFVWYYGAMNSGKPYWTPVYVDTTLEYESISYVRPLFAENRIIGIVGMDASFEKMSDVVRNVRVYDSGYAFLLDQNGDFIVEPPVNLTHAGALELLTGAEGVVEFDDEFWAYYELENGHVIVLVAPKSDVISFLSALQHKFVLNIILFAAALLVLMLFMRSVTMREVEM